MLSKPDMWESEEFRLKFSKIPRHLQSKFLQGIQDLYRQESDSMLDFIRQSRNSLRLTASEIKDEQEVLQLTGKKLSSERSKNRIDVGDNPNRRRENSNMSTRSYPPQSARHKPYCPSPEPMMNPSYPRPAERLPPLAAKTTMHFENEETFDPEDDEDFFKEETQEIMRATSRAANVHENERARQLDRIEKLKKQRKEKKEANQEVAHEMVREASNLEKQKTKEQKKQEMKVKAKLEEKKRRREMTGLGNDRSASSASMLPDVDVNTEIIRTPRPRSPASLDSSPAPPEQAEAAMATPAPAPEPTEEESKKEKKKKKKEKKEKEKKEKKEKKSKKNKEEPVAVAVDIPV